MASTATAADEQLADAHELVRTFVLDNDADQDAAAHHLVQRFDGLGVTVLRRMIRSLGAGRHMSRHIDRATADSLRGDVAGMLLRREIARREARETALRHLHMLLGGTHSLALDARDIDLGVTGAAEALVDADLTYELADAISTVRRAAAIVRQIERGEQG